MKAMRLLLAVVAILLLAVLLFVVLGETGAVDSHLYHAESSTQRNGQAGFQYPTEAGRDVSYSLQIYYDSRLTPRATHQRQVWTASGQAPKLDIDVDVIPTVLGNPRLPLYKSFTVEFVASFDSATADGAYRLDGEVKGSTEMKVVGLCSAQKALDLARDEIVANVQEFLQEQLER